MRKLTDFLHSIHSKVISNVFFCGSCFLGKIFRQPFSHESLRANIPLELVRRDVFYIT